MLDRRYRRFQTAIAVTVSTVLERAEGQIVNLSAGGAQIIGASLPERSRCQIDFEGQTIYATIMWSEPDRMGLSFPYELRDGPLFDRLQAEEAAVEETFTLSPAAIIRASSVFGRRVTG